MNKIGRNDPCPCGSGLKYKKCHLGRQLENVFFETATNVDGPKDSSAQSSLFAFNRDSLLLSLAALQLEPRNHGKNVRLEQLVFDVLLKGKRNNKQVGQRELEAIFASQYRYHHLEDPITSFFTENTIFFGGNYTVYPGITSEGASILNTFLEAVFTNMNSLPPAFKNKIEAGITWLLYLSEAMATTAGHKRYRVEANEETGVYVPEEGRLNELKNAVFFRNDYIEKLSKHIGFTTTELAAFTITKELLPDTFDPDDSILLERPLLKLEEGYLFLFPPEIVHCGMAFIKRVATEEKCEALFIEAVHAWQWSKIIEHAYAMQWQQTSIQLPIAHPELNIRESIFRFDNDKLAYVCFVMNKPHFGDRYASQFGTIPVESAERPNLEERNEQIRQFLDELNKNTAYRYFTLYILGSVGEQRFFIWPRPEGDNQTLTLNFNDLEKLVFAGDVDQLTLWKFAKAYLRATQVTVFSPFTSILDAYVLFKENQGSLLPTDDEPPTNLYIVMGTSQDFERETLAKRDEHAAKRLYKEGIADVPVIRHKDFAPIYREREISLNNRLLLESFPFPLWIVNKQAKNRREKRASNDFVEAVAFWLSKLTPYLHSSFQNLGLSPIEVVIELDQKLLTGNETFEWEAVQKDAIPIPVSHKGRVITIQLPFALAHLFILENNEGERHIIKKVLEGFNLMLVNAGLPAISETDVEVMIDTAIPLGPAKMILMIDSGKDPRLDTRDLLGPRYIQDPDTAYILDHLVELICPETPIPALIRTQNEKSALCNKIVAALIQRIVQKLTAFDARELVDWLIRYNEQYVYKKEFREYQIPAKMACFSDFPTEVRKYMEEESKVVSSTLSIRCLIEFIAADPQFGTKRINMDDVDELLALMNEVLSWGFIADAIHLGMDDPQMGLLPSGRIGMSHEFEEKFIRPFGEARAETEIHSYTTAFKTKMQIATESTPAEYTPEVKEIDDAFLSEWGISLTHIMYIKRALISFGMAHNTSCMKMEESALVKAIQENNEELADPVVRAGLQLLSLSKRASLNKAPNGFDKDDIYPWKYNRALSYLRRPIIKLVDPADKSTYYYWGFRHVMAAGENLRVLVMNGRIKSKEGGALNTLVAKMNAQKGDDFRNRVYQWLLNNTGLHVIPYEVTIAPKGHLLADKDYGDIDVLAIDNIRKIIYAVECKNTVSARVIHEMKTELDKYLGREGNSGMIQKHVERSGWLEHNKGVLEKFVSSPDEYTIRSIVLSSEDIPLVYLAKEKLPLPVIAFPVIKRRGWEEVDRWFS